MNRHRSLALHLLGTSLLTLGAAATHPALGATADGGGAKGAPAVTYVVTKTADTNDGVCDIADCSLREALAAANAAPPLDRIEFAPGVKGGTIGLSGAFGQLTVSSAVVIDAEAGGGGAVTVEGSGGIGRVFQVTAAGDATLLGLVITGGRREDGSGIFNQGALLLRRSVVTGNDGDFTFVIGTGIYSDGTLTVEQSTISGNRAGRGTGIGIQGGTATIRDSTVSGNVSVGFLGPAINVAAGSVTIENSTITRNLISGSTRKSAAGSKGAGGAITLLGGSLSLASSIVAGNDAGSELNCFAGGGTITSLGFNVVAGSCPIIASDVLVANADTFTEVLDASLADNGGPTLTHDLLPDSPAIDLGGSCGPTDQRGQAAPVDGDGDGDSDCDAGAVEAPAVAPPDDDDPPVPVELSTFDVNSGPGAD